MPYPADENVVKTSKELVSTLKGAFHTPPGFRPAHAKGILLNGTFTPTPLAAQLSSAPHFSSPTPILARFSNSTGLPHIPDTDPNANPRGLAVRFILGERKHTDIIAHSTPFFPTRTGAEFLQLLQAIGGGTAGDFLASHPAAKAFVEAPKPFPVGFETQQYFGVNAFKLVDSADKGTFVRYQITPTAVKVLDTVDLEGKDADFLFEALKDTLAKGPISLKLEAQVAEEGDVTDDATVHWPSSRAIVELGTLELKSVEEDGEPQPEQKRIIFDPIPRVQGIEPSADPLLDMRASVYLASGLERRAA
ncbi:catalase-like domain-containing protein [Naematelia encephala]|uniref:Catalase-like domain-containing protein n=1 Tax=Naematelia encephala TaxID=71784 RepID=A0A1Y2BI27_9TREE|nr:catalase-like domain-containing protein [Naematelia encephala]